VLTIAGATFVSPAYAECSFGSSLSSSTITEGTSSVTVSGTDTCDPPGTTMDVFLRSVPSGGTCPGTTNISSSSTKTSNGAFSANVPTSSLPPGSYCVYSQSASFPGCLYCISGVPLTVYRFWPRPQIIRADLYVAAFLVVLIYAVIKRRTAIEKR
jgi:hypothetical protein